MLSAPSSKTETRQTRRAHCDDRVHSHARPPHQSNRMALVAVLLAFVSLSACGVTTGASAHAATQHCGSVSALVGPSPSASTNPADAEHCFAQAYAQCNAATLVYTQHGLDTGVTRTFTILTNGQGCSIQDMVHSYLVAIKGTPPPDLSYYCSGLQQKQSGLVVTGCGQDGDVSIPAA